MTEEDHEEIWDRFEAGESLTAIGRNLTTVRSYIYRHNSCRPQPEPEPSVWSDHRLSLPEREEISRGLVRGDSFRTIAAVIGREPSTVSREVNRNGGREQYRATDAESATRERARLPRHPKLIANPDLADLVTAKLEAYWSPEQIAGWLRLHHGGDACMQVSHESIYLALYDGILDIGPKDCLRTKRPRRRRRYRRSNNGEGVLKNLVLIRHRPTEIDAISEFGHWEGDLIIGNATTAVVSLVERVSRYTILVPLPGRRTSEALNDALPPVLLRLPEHMVLSITWDQGKEIAGHEILSTRAGIDVYVCDPHSPWQRGTNENTNSLIRQWFPKSTNFYTTDPSDLAAAAMQLNQRPRRTLDWCTPDEVVQAHQPPNRRGQVTDPLTGSGTD